MKYIFIFLVIFLSACSNLDRADVSSTATQSGSYANLLVINDYMYVINKEKLQTFDVKDGANPILLDDLDLGFNIESLLYHKGNLFIGSQSSMFIYEIAKSGIPQEKSVTNYGFFGEDFCRQDPITVNDEYAYASLSARISGECARFQLNELRVYDISNIAQPELINSIQMESPKGLALDGDVLFVCEKENGLKVFDVSDPLNLELIHHFDGFDAFDVIADDGLVIVVGPEKIYEYDYSDIDNMKYLSQLDF
ncbi:LVIVD repeat-containing protein [Portibacter lacus]|uniref:LVIVD repeat-containing protein n=1 Tax=Portibacter lacus TaxID=1099794 RepID=A0AA37SS97_9BACT|nr:hypothetical protein [Portibacter lacus]GLR18714.1 hypothetical protein GCM10007940_33300 [Portibacter lacus]